MTKPPCPKCSTTTYVYLHEKLYWGSKWDATRYACIACRVAWIDEDDNQIEGQTKVVFG